MSNVAVLENTDDAVERGTVEPLLGHPEQLAPHIVKARRNVRAGCPVGLSGQRWADLRRLFGPTFKENWSAVVVDETVEALAVVGWAAEGSTAEDPENDPAAVAVGEAWERSELAAGCEGLFTAACTDGQAFLIVDFERAPDGTADLQRPTAFVNTAYDGNVGLEVIAVDGDGTILVAVRHEKEVLVRDRRTGLLIRLAEWFLNLVGRSLELAARDYVTCDLRTEYVYDRLADETALRTFLREPGRTERQVRKEDGQWVDAEPGDHEVWAYGNPILAFVSPGGGEVADLEDAQRAVNRAALDCIAAGNIDALRLVWTLDCAPIMGGEEGKDPDGTVYLEPGACLSLRSTKTGGGGSIGSIPPADIGALESVYRTRVETLLALGRTSTSVLPWNSNGTRTYASGYALQLSNATFRGKILRYQTRFGVSLELLAQTWQRMAGAEPVDVVPTWQRCSFTTRAEDLADATASDALNLPESYTANILGLTQAQARAWAKRNAAADEARAAAVRGQAGQDLFGAALQG